jgi:hypothetical protein
MLLFERCASSTNVFACSAGSNEGIDKANASEQLDADPMKIREPVLLFEARPQPDAKAKRSW